MQRFFITRAYWERKKVQSCLTLKNDGRGRQVYIFFRLFPTGFSNRNFNVTSTGQFGGIKQCLKYIVKKHKKLKSNIFTILFEYMYPNPKYILKVSWTWWVKNSVFQCKCTFPIIAMKTLQYFKICV